MKEIVERDEVPCIAACQPSERHCLMSIGRLLILACPLVRRHRTPASERRVRAAPLIG
jgi:hypothetical protein